MNRPSSGPSAQALYWVCYDATVTSAVSLGYSLAATQTTDWLPATRSTQRAGAPLCRPGGQRPSIALGSEVPLATAGARTVTQALYAVVGLSENNPVKVAGPAGTAASMTATLHVRSRRIFPSQTSAPPTLKASSRSHSNAEI